jgi:hypothetical protein
MRRNSGELARRAPPLFMQAFVQNAGLGDFHGIRHGLWTNGRRDRLAGENSLGWRTGPDENENRWVLILIRREIRR